MQWFFALRYLFSRSSHSVINIIAGVSLVSVAIPVAAMVILLSVFNGFEVIVKDMYAQSDADIEIYNIGEVTDSLRDIVVTTQGVAAASVALEGEALARTESRQTAVMLRGVDDHYFEVFPADLHTLQGSLTLTHGEINKALITSDISQLLGIYTTVASRLTLHSIGGGDVGSLLPIMGMRQTKVHVGGIVRSNQQFKGQVIIPLRAAEQIFDYNKCKFFVRTDQSAERVKSRLKQRLGEDVTIKTRNEKNSLFYQIMEYEKWAVFFVALLVLLIASLSIIGTVIMLIVEKRDQQTTMLSMGADSRFIRGIFVREGLLISGIGGGAGLVLGIFVVLIQQWFGLIELPSDGFVVQSYPVKLEIIDIILIFTTFVAIAWSVSQVAANTMIKRRL